MRAEGLGGLERFCSPGKGRGLRALQPFQVGDLLFSCPAYAYVLTVNERGNHCEYCFTRKKIGPCTSWNVLPWLFLGKTGIPRRL